MPSRTLHNLMNSLINGFSGNEIHQFMDRYAKKYRQKHRDVGGHDLTALIQLIFLYKHKYSVTDIIKTYALHKFMDGSMSGLQSAVRKKNKGYGKKDSTEEIIKKLKKEMFRL